jgi:hypothetical protein
VADLQAAAQVDEFFFPRGQVVRGFDRVGEPPPDRDAEDYGRDAFDYHYPAPAAEAGDAVHVADAGGRDWVSEVCGGIAWW